ncbi:DUF3107 family protein [Janibacter limosus]|uniref:DUF3107 family protein n=1 Tax=Janibacter limosus TaxID=53458 RepID=A0AC61U660_9MICO|nr:DUF3107 family protein [Janibacter limosus]
MSSHTPGTRVQRMPRAQRRAQLLEAALGVFVAKGYHAAAMEDIAESAGVSKPVLYQHFPGKLELYLALLDDQCDHLEALVLEALDSSDDHEERVYATVRAFFNFVADEGGSFRLIYESDLTNDPQVRHRLDALEAQLGEAIAQRIIQDTPLPMELAEMLGPAMSGAARVMARTGWRTAPTSPRRSPPGQQATSRGAGSAPSRSTGWGRSTPPPALSPASDTMSGSSPTDTEGVTVEVKIGIQNVAREVVIEATGSEAEIEAAVQTALDGGSPVLTDDKGRRVMVPAGALGYVEVGEPTRGRVGFGA